MKAVPFLELGQPSIGKLQRNLLIRRKLDIDQRQKAPSLFLNEVTVEIYSLNWSRTQVASPRSSSERVLLRLRFVMELETCRPFLPSRIIRETFACPCSLDNLNLGVCSSRAIHSWAIAQLIFISKCQRNGLQHKVLCQLRSFFFFHVHQGHFCRRDPSKFPVRPWRYLLLNAVDQKLKIATFLLDYGAFWSIVTSTQSHASGFDSSTIIALLSTMKTLLKDKRLLKGNSYRQK